MDSAYAVLSAEREDVASDQDFDYVSLQLCATMTTKEVG
jgi:hypothetical protein